jgi:hypothetical protein
VGACETKVPDDQLENWIVSWPGRVPKGAGRAAKPGAARAKKRVGQAAAVKAATPKATARAAGVRTPKVKRKA